MQSWARLKKQVMKILTIPPYLLDLGTTTKGESCSIFTYHTGVSVNDAVTRDTFDGIDFTLTFHTIDNITDRISHSKGRILLSKIDVSRAFTGGGLWQKIHCPANDNVE